MKVALAHDHLFQIGGAERVLKEFKAVFPHAPIYTLIYDQNKSKQFSGFDIRTSYLQNIPGSTKIFKFLLPFMPSAWESFDFSDYDVVLTSSSAFVKGIITSPKTTQVCYCHSPIRYLWSDSLSYVDNLRLPSPGKIYLRQILSKLRAWDYSAAQRVDHFVANSIFVADRIKKYYGRDSRVIYPPVAVENFEASQEADKFYLLISRLRPYKKVDMAIRAFNALRIPLVIIGGGEEFPYLKRIANRNITFLGEVSDDVRDKYLARCIALIHPQEEDFGITAVEAMASGKPVIAYGSGGALETIINGETGVFFYDQNWEALADTVIRFQAADFSPQVIAEHAQKFSTDRFRREISELINSL